MKQSYLKNVHVAYFLLSIAILIIALFSNWVTLHYFEMGIASSDLDKTTSGLAFKSALAMMSASLICFSLSKIITDKSITENLRLLGFGLWIFELAIMSCTQYFIFKRDAAPLQAAEQQEELYSQSIEEHRAMALAGNENSRVQGRSKYTSNRMHASELLRTSQSETSKADAIRDKLATSLSLKKVTFAGVLSPTVLLFLAIARSFFLSVISIRFFTLFGSMFRRGLDLQEANGGNLPDGSDPKRKRPALDKKDEFKKESPSTQAPSSEAISAILAAKNEDVSKDETENNKNVSLALADSPLSLESSSVSLSKAPLYEDAKKDVRPPRKKKLPGIADTHVSEQKDSRYKRVIREVKSKRITPSIRDIKAFAKCGEDVARRYREDMLKRGITMELPDGTHILKPKLKAV